MTWRINWSKELSVGIPEIDAEHQHFINQVNEFNKAIRERADISVFMKQLKSIVKNVRDHFEHEEHLFELNHYADQQRHTQIHQTILKHLEKRIALLSETSPEPEWIRLGIEIRDALINHLLTEDMKYKGMNTKQHDEDC